MTPTLRREIALPVSSATARSLAALAVLVVFLLRDAILRGRTFYIRDLHLQWYGQMESFVRSVTSGSWPVWDPFVSFGQPLLANANNQLLYPLTWLNLLMRPWTYYTLYFAFHLLLSGAGMMALCRRLGLTVETALATAALWICCGPMLSLGNVWNHLAAVAWMPWAILAADRAAATGRVRPALLWGAILALQILAGSPDYLAMTTLLAVPLALTAAGGTRRDALLRVAFVTSIAVAFALLLSAGQLLPSLDVARGSDRWNMAAEERTYWSVHPVLLAQMFVPLFWGELPLNAHWSATLFESREPFLLSLYVGPLVMAAMFAALTAPRRGRNVLLAGAIGFTLFALGRFGLFYTIATTVLPPLKVIRFPAKAMVVATFCACVLAGMGLEAWRRSDGTRRRWLAVVVVPLGLLAAAAAALAFAARFDADRWGPSFLLVHPGAPSFTAALAGTAGKLLAMAIAAAILAGLALLRARGEARYAALALAAASVGHLAWTHRGLNPTAPKDLFLYRPPVLAALDQEDRRRVFVYDYLMTPDRSQRHLKRDTPYVTPAPAGRSPAMWTSALAFRSYLVPPIGAAWGLFDSFGRDSLNIQQTAMAEMNALLAYAEGTPLFTRVLRMGAVSQVLALHEDGLGELELQTTLPPPFFEPLRVYRVRAPLPRAYVVDGVRISERGFDWIEAPQFDPEREVILPAGVPRAPVRDFRGAARIVDLRPDRLRLETSASSEAHLVLADAWDPGWRATVDGRPAPVLRANAAFRAVAVPAGTHVVELVYRPASVVRGLLVSAAAALAGLAFALVPAKP